MKNEDEKIVLYQKIGLMFYSIASADKLIHPKEKQKLLELLKKFGNDLMDFSVPKNVDAYSQIMVEFDLAESTKRDSEECMQEFIEFYKNHTHIITSELKSFLWAVANKMALAVAGYNKSELVKLSQLKILIRNNEQSDK